MNLSLLLWFIAAHFSADLVFQTNNTIKKKQSSDMKVMLKGNLYHAVAHFILYLIILFLYFKSEYAIIPAFILFFIHMVIDILKSYIIKKHPFMKYSFLLFLSDQIMHILIIFIIMLSITNNLRYGHATISFELVKNSILHMTFYNKILCSAVILIVGLWGVGIAIRIIMEHIRYEPYKKAINEGIIINEEQNDNGVRDGGFIIGLLERILIICAVVTHMDELIGFIITVKSIARFKKFDDDRFVEYFIIGSFISMFSAIAAGLIIKSLI